MSAARLIQGDARHLPLADRSVHCCISSPPYWGLRDYGVDGQIGLEPTPDAFVATMISVFREVRRVLRDDGTAWINLGDSYATRLGGDGWGDYEWKTGGPVKPADGTVSTVRRNRADVGLKPKDLVGIPWRVALALQADGWYLRSDIIWAKPNPMPESVTDRPTKSHEYLFLMSKAERYYYDAEAVREGAEYGRREWTGRLRRGVENGDGHRSSTGSTIGSDPSAGRNLRSVWSIPTEAYPGAHFATFPRRLVEPCIRAGTSEKGVCPACGAGWVREVERESQPAAYEARKYGDDPLHRTKRNLGARYQAQLDANPLHTLGWRPACDCDAGDPIPATVLDPFCGSGTTLVVASALGRSAIGIDLNPEYLSLARRRIERPHAPVPRPEREEVFPLFA